MNVTAEVKSVFVGVNKDAFCTSLEQRATTFLLPVECPGVAVEQTLDEA
jgi:hypothetical protein